MSNKDLRCLVIYHAIETLKAALNLITDLIQKHIPFAANFRFSPFSVFSEA